MKRKIIIVAVVIISILILSSIFLITGGSDLIPPDNGDPDDDLSDILINTPLTGYTVPETNSWQYIEITGSLTKNTINSKTVTRITVCWHDNIDYGRQILVPTTNWNTKMLITRLGSGSHLLQARAESSSGEVLADYSVSIIIPDKYVYYFDSTNPPSCQETFDYQWGFSYGFKFPYKMSGDQTQYWLKGEILKVSGMIHVSLIAPSTARDLYFDVWNEVTGQWTIVNKNVHVSFSECTTPPCGSAWKQVDALGDNVWGNMICFSGMSADGYGASPHDTVDGFKGEIWVKPGTIEYNTSPLEILLKMLSGNNLEYPPGS